MYSSNLSPTGSWYKYVQISLSQDAGKICTNLSLPVSWYPYVQYKSLSHRKLAQMCTNLSLTQDTGKIYIQLSLSHSTCKLHGTSMYSTNLSLTRSWHKYVRISLLQDASQHMYKSLFHRTPVNICTNLSLTGHQ